MALQTEFRRDEMVIAIDGAEHRTTLTIGHEDALDLLGRMTEYYGKVEFHTAPKQRGFFRRLFGTH